MSRYSTHSEDENQSAGPYAVLKKKKKKLIAFLSTSVLLDGLKSWISRLRIKYTHQLILTSNVYLQKSKRFWFLYFCPINNFLLNHLSFWWRFQLEDEVMTRLTGKIPVKVVNSGCILMHCMGSPGYEKYNFSVKPPGQLLDLADHFIFEWLKFNSRTTASNCIDLVLLNKAGSGGGFPWAQLQF